MHKTKISFYNVKFRKLQFCLKQSPNFSFIIFFQQLFLNFSMFLFLSTYEINLKLGYIYVDDMLKISRKSKTGNKLSWSIECYKSKF